jgi:HK97 family phage prohead protease
METIYKTFRAEVKDIEEDGSLNMFIPVSSGKADRDGEVIEPLAFKKTIKEFMKHPVLVASHDYRDLTNQIGEWTKLKITPEGIEGKPKYYVNAGNEQADWAHYLASNGKAAYSVGFMPKLWVDGDGEKTPRRTYKEIELLEISQVIIPSNRDAIMGMRSKGVDSVVGEILDEVEAEIKQYQCECLECGHKFESEKHCADTQCPKCGGKTRRAERPGVGREAEDVVTKPEVTEDYIRVPVSEGHGDHKIRTINISTDEGIKALYCVDCKENITYLFSKEKGWTMAKAKKWVKEHSNKYIISETTNNIDDEIIITASKQPDNIQIFERGTSQSEIIDEIDYLKTLIVNDGLSEDGKKSFEDLMRVSGYDNPVLIADVPSGQTVTDSETDSAFIKTLYEIIKEQMEVK